MAGLQSRALISLPSSSLSSSFSLRPRAGLSSFSRLSPTKPPKLSLNFKETITIRNQGIGCEKPTTLNSQIPTSTPAEDGEGEKDELIKSKLYAIAEAAADRAEMHAIIGEQRNNWNVLLLNSINSITLAASVSAGLSSMSTTHGLAFRISSVALYTAATFLSCVMNYLQPSQLAEEQRNAVRLFRQVEKRIGTTLALRHTSTADVEDAIQRILSIDKAYPLPLLSVMLEKFSKTVKPAVWWPERHHHGELTEMKKRRHGWNQRLEKEMKVVADALKEKDIEDYLRLGKLVLKTNKFLAITGPVLTGIATIATCLGSGSWLGVVGVVGGALATVVNTLEHGGQVGMVFEMYRNCAGYYRELEEEIRWNLEESDVERRENGNLLELKLGLKLGRSVSDLRSFSSSSSSSSSSNSGEEEFAGKLF